MNKLSYDTPNTGLLPLKGNLAFKKPALVDCIEKDGVMEIWQVHQDGREHRLEMISLVECLSLA